MAAEVINLNNTNPGAPSAAWQATHAYALGATILDSASHVQMVTTAGTSGGSTPSFNHAGGTTTDGSVVWTDQGIAAAPAINVLWLKGSQSGVEPISGFPIYPVSASVPYMVGDSGSGGSAGVVPPAPSGSAAAGKFIRADATWAVPIIGAGSPTQTANLVVAGPASGSPAIPTFRSLVAADLPAGIGSVTSVALTMPAEFSVAGSPITNSGTLAVSKANQNANIVYAGPASGSPAAPTFRSLAILDIPAAALVRKVTLAVDGGGSVPATGAVNRFGQVDYSGVIVGWAVFGNISGSLTVDVWKKAGTPPPTATAPVIPTSSDKISASAPVTLSSAQSAAGGATEVSTWTKPVSSGDTFGFSIASISTITAFTLEIYIQQ